MGPAQASRVILSLQPRTGHSAALEPSPRRLGGRRTKGQDGGENRFHRSPILALRLTRRRLAIRLHLRSRSAALELRRPNRRIEERLMREFLRSLEEKLDGKTGRRKAPITHAIMRSKRLTLAILEAHAFCRLLQYFGATL